jgi:hypothetical protein
MTVTTNEHGVNNIFPKEPEMRVMDVSVTNSEKGELLNGRLAMIGFVAALGSYISTGQIIPGIF